MEKHEIIHWLETPDPAKLFQQADAVRRECCGEAVHLRGLIEFSNYCRRECHYCGLRQNNTTLPRYRMTLDEIFDVARNAAGLGYKTLVLQSGEDGSYSTEEFCCLVTRIKEETGCAITLSIGERPFADYKKFRKAGADRYLLRFEVSRRELFQQLKPDSSLENRLRCLSWLKELGYQVGSGIMVGLPGQTNEILAEDLLLLAKLDLDMIGIGPFIAHPATPLAQAADGNIDLTLRVIALVRILTTHTHMPATTAIGSLSPDGRQKALQCGANVLMPNVTPTKYRRYYEIYPHKICVDENPSDCRGCVATMVQSVGRSVDDGFGHSLK